MSRHPLRALDLGVRRRIDSLVAGDHEGLRLGVGSEREEVVRYQPGDDVRRIDWNITARSIGNACVAATARQPTRHLGAARRDSEHGVRHR